MKTYRFSIVIEKDEEGYFDFCPELQEYYTQWDTYEEVLENIKDAIRLYVNDRLENGEEVPQTQSVSLTSLEVAVWWRNTANFKRCRAFGGKVQRIIKIKTILSCFLYFNQLTN